MSGPAITWLERDAKGLLERHGVIVAPRVGDTYPVHPTDGIERCLVHLNQVSAIEYPHDGEPHDGESIA